MKRQHFFAVILGLGTAFALDSRGLHITDELWWLIMLIVGFSGNIIYFKLKS